MQTQPHTSDDDNPIADLVVYRIADTLFHYDRSRKPGYVVRIPLQRMSADIVTYWIGAALAVVEAVTPEQWAALCPQLVEDAV